MLRPLHDLFHRRMARRAGRLARRLAPYIPGGAVLLDVGSGTGHNAEALRRAGATCFEVDVVDFHVAGDGPLLFDGSRMPLKDGAVDVGLLIHSLGFAEDPAALLCEAARVARRGVVVIQSTHRGPWGRAYLAARGWLQGHGAFRACRLLGLIPPAPDAMRSRTLFSRERLRTVVAEAGLRLKSLEPEAGLASLASRDLLVLERPAPRPPGAPAVSVIVPARNEEALLPATLDAILRARADFEAGAGSVEVLVVDDRSDDRTPEVLARYAATAGVRVARVEARGAARARNAGARLARGDVLVFLDADTHPPRGAFGRFAALADVGFEAGIARLGALDGGLRARAWWAYWNAVRRLPLARAKAMPACMFCTRAAFDEFGPFDERVAIGEEWPILAGLYRARPEAFIYDRATTALSSGRRMELQPFGYLRTFVKYVWAILSFRGRVHYHDRIRHPAPAEPS